MPTQVAVIYYSATGNVHKLAEAIADGARETGADVRLRRVRELAPEEAIQENQAWARHRDETANTVEEATLGDLEWADGFAFGFASATLPRMSRTVSFCGAFGGWTT